MNLTTKIEHHKKMMNSVLELSNLAFQSAQEGDSDKTYNIIENRQRAIGIISSTQADIERMLNLLTSDNVNNELINYIKEWSNDIGLWEQKVLKVDQTILEILENMKEETAKELSSIFTNRQMVSGYNHTSLKK